MLLRDLMAAWDALVAEQPVHASDAPSPTCGRHRRTPRPRARRAPACRSDARPSPTCPAGWRVAAHPRPAGRSSRTRCWRARTAARSSGARGGTARGSGLRLAGVRGRGRARQRDELVDRRACSPIGSLCFALGSVPLYFDTLDPAVVAGTFFVGSIFFTSAGYLQFHETLRAPGGVLAESARPRPAGVAGGLEAAPDRLLGGARPAGRARCSSTSAPSRRPRRT